MKFGEVKAGIWVLGIRNLCRGTLELENEIVGCFKLVIIILSRIRDVKFLEFGL